ncbi:ThuA domain-containing protein [Pontibacter sp. G13]|uniref:ThuA domain-containing protein n=1 Tax=Pontibacter sp. G13 TaxID=3074898 RepID=UPI00288AE5CC|nr:ThuA domain-containing protein [Pontibacter sp. G13]WNJ19805.1 ThuA domain-containing protein [Pontibacter sp. G13]
MKRGILILLLLAAVAFFGIRSIFFSGQSEIHMLVFSKTEGYRHASIEPGIDALQKLGETHGFSVHATEDAAVFQEKELQKYNVVVFLNTTGDILNADQQTEFKRYIQAGGGFVGIHAAADTEYDWPWYNQLVGAYFESHPNDPNVREAKIDVINPDHPATRALPMGWKRLDEWYNYKSIQPHIQVLLNLDETSYEGGTNGENHPISWHHEFDGGRTFYTGLGHTAESFVETEFLEHLWGGIQYAAGEGKPVDYNNGRVAPEENRFTKKELVSNLNEPMEMAMLPDGSILFIERRGKLKRYDFAKEDYEVVGELNVFSKFEDGLLGMALDPKFAENNWIYLYYSPPTDTLNVLSRFEFKNNQLVLESEKQLLEVKTQRETCCHSGGSVEFGPDGAIYVSTGDDTNPFKSGGFSPSDERPGQKYFDAQRTSGNTMDLRGKILRVMPTAAGGYEIPEGNLFPKDGSVGRPEIYVMGCRNPFRISIDQHSGYLYWGDVGPDAGKSKENRGSRGYDEVNQAKQAGYYGWPYFVGNNQPYREFDFETKTSGPAHDPAKPINNSPNNTGATELPPAQPAMIYYPYAASEEFPLMGEGGRNAMAGPIFYEADFPNAKRKFPAYFEGKFFSYDWMRGLIMVNTFDEEGNWKSMEQFMPSSAFSNPVDMFFSPEGDLYVLEYGTNWFTQNPDARLSKIEYVAGNRQPVATLEANAQFGVAPMTVKFDGTGSMDFDGDELAFLWNFGDGGSMSKEMAPEFTFEKPGTYTVKLKVTDPDGKQAEAETKVYVGNDLPQVAWVFKGNRTFFWDRGSLDYQVKVSDTEDADIDPARVNISIDYLEQGADITEIAQGHEALAAASRSAVGKTLIDGSDCMACHKMDQASVGPTYLEIAERYAEEAGAVEKLATKVINGGSGVWGDHAMSAHPQLSQDQAEQMVKYILSVGDEPEEVEGLPMTGTYRFNQHKKPTGAYILNASYTDNGGTEIGPLTGRSMITLRHPVVPAVGYDYQFKGIDYEVTGEMMPGVEEPFFVYVANPESHAVYEDIDLTGIGSIDFTMFLTKQYSRGGTIVVHTDGLDGEVIGKVVVDQENLPEGLHVAKVELLPTIGKHDLYIEYQAKRRAKALGAIMSLEFKPANGL